MKSLKINISEEAKNKLNQLLNVNPIYSCIRIDYEPQCGNSSVNLCLDEFKSDYIIDEVDDVFFMYKDFLTIYISSIDIIYENSSFMLKAIPANSDKSKQTGSCCKTSNCSNNCNCNNHSCGKGCKCNKTLCSNKSNCSNCPYNTL